MRTLSTHEFVMIVSSVVYVVVVASRRRRIAFQSGNGNMHENVVAIKGNVATVNCVSEVEKHVVNAMLHLKDRASVTLKLWEKSDVERLCTRCIKRMAAEKAAKKKENVEKRCSKCKKELPRSGYITNKMWFTNDAKRKCRNCENRKRGYWICIGCPGFKAINEFSSWLKSRSQKKNDGTARCNTCMTAAEKQEATLRKRTVAKIMKHSGGDNVKEDSP